MLNLSVMLYSISGKRGFRRQADQTREQQVAALLHTQRTRNEERRAPNGLAEAFQHQRFSPADRRAQQTQRKPHLAGPHEPAEQTQRETRRDRSRLLDRKSTRLNSSH